MNDGFVQWSIADNNAQLRTQLEPNDTLRICLFDAMGSAKGSDDAMGYVHSFDVEDLVDIVSVPMETARKQSPLGAGHPVDGTRRCDHIVALYGRTFLQPLNQM